MAWRQSGAARVCRALSRGATAATDLATMPGAASNGVEVERSLSPAVPLRAVAGHLHLHEYRAGEAICEQGKEGSELFIIARGTVDFFVEGGGKVGSRAAPARASSRARCCAR